MKSGTSFRFSISSSLTSFTGLFDSVFKVSFAFAFFSVVGAIVVFAVVDRLDGGTLAVVVLIGFDVVLVLFVVNVDSSFLVVVIVSGVVLVVGVIPEYILAIEDVSNNSSASTIFSVVEGTGVVVLLVLAIVTLLVVDVLGVVGRRVVVDLGVVVLFAVDALGVVVRLWVVARIVVERGVVVLRGRLVDVLVDVVVVIVDGGAAVVEEAFILTSSSRYSRIGVADSSSIIVGT